MKIKSIKKRKESDTEKKLVQTILKDLDKHTKGKKLARPAQACLRSKG